MRVMVIGATGTIGSAVTNRLSNRHEIVEGGHRAGEFRVDLSSPASIERLFKAVGAIDAVVSTAGLAKFASLDELGDDDYHLGLSNKLMGQVNLIRIGRRTITDRGSFTVTSGALAQEPMGGAH